MKKCTLTCAQTYFSAAWSRTGRKGPYAHYYMQVQPNGGSFVGMCILSYYPEPPVTPNVEEPFMDRRVAAKVLLSLPCASEMHAC
jgi:hypothetical protein